MAVLNEVKFKIRRSALASRMFSVPQLEKATRLNRQSIRSEVSRMEKEGLIERVSLGRSSSSKKGGRPALTYQLSSDPEKRFELLRSVRAFDAELREPVARPAVPQSKHYLLAREKLLRATNRILALSETEKEDLLAHVLRSLDYARREEASDQNEMQAVLASIDMLEAKARFLLSGDWERAIVLLDAARHASLQTGERPLAVEVDAFVQSIVDDMSKRIRIYDEADDFRAIDAILKDLSVVKHRFPALPGLDTQLILAERIASRAREREIQSRVEERVRQQRVAIQELLRQEQRGLVSRMQGNPQEQELVEKRTSARPSPLEVFGEGFVLHRRPAPGREAMAYGVYYEERN